MTAEDISEALGAIIGELRHDDGPDAPRAKCDECDYEGPFATISCQCYEFSCKPEARGYGCPNGVAYCPVCDECIDTRSIAKALMRVESLFGMVEASATREAKLADALREALVEWKALAEAFVFPSDEFCDRRDMADADLGRISRFRALLENVGWAGAK